ncbi:class I SAM-dependent methyltransferase [Formosa sp. 4Alg 33]|uniref:class I SAM-dependent methyltransferase n=1 Tax=Formosa sp. 4Alg 33 TaxID=3382189 RepID=UPI003D9C48F8
MYVKLKQAVKQIIPEKWLQKHQDTLRPFVAMFYKGNRFKCNVCGFKMSQFISLYDGKTLCPNCGSLSRTRRLWSIIEHELSDKKVLHFSPPRVLSKVLENLKNTDYEPSDYMGEFQAKRQYNIEAIDAPNNTYDVIICYHVLEHIEQDVQAMTELYRILKPQGRCYIQTPFKSGNIYEDKTIVTPSERLKHFGQEDHLRIYSVDGLNSRLKSVGFNTTVNNFSSESQNYHGFNTKETVIVAQKI